MRVLRKTSPRPLASGIQRPNAMQHVFPMAGLIAKSRPFFRYASGNAVRDSKGTNTRKAVRTECRTEVPIEPNAMPSRSLARTWPRRRGFGEARSPVMQTGLMSCAFPS